ncbi:glycosyltransferase family 2 protein [Poseidonibacter lekithochrous]|uniref:glycosyltransferase family 2 protein n=1 Tax=Poseidonibacter lekithochrous TaxID=1904463 RepID=UPI0008FCCB14|nr:glycosyltransferase family 2 protein [Poseidonibacter lekithochrous]QKJ23788.1 glycosyltransferase, family 2 [Poseidonibacter lekithochrous]
MNTYTNKLSIVIITKNEEKFIADAIKSSLFADEVLILDSGSSDKTCEIAKELGAKVLFQEWLGFGAQKNKAVELASNDWVFVLDSDERIPNELKDEILKTIENPNSDGYFVARLNNFFGKDIKSCGLYPDYSIRLFNRTKGSFNDVPVHESVQMKITPSHLKNHMIHLAYDSIEEFIQKQNRYSSLNHKKKSLFKAIVNPYWTFFKLFIIKKGFLDGYHGFIIAKLYSQYTFWKYVK